MTLLKQDFPLKTYNSFGTETRAAYYAAPEDPKQLKEVLEQYDFRQMPFLLLGEGSNLLFTGDFDGLVLHPAMKGIKILTNRKDHVMVRVGAGENWDRWVEHATGSGWYGLENLSLIPGSVGASPVQNIGAYGVELKDYFAWLEAWDTRTRKQVRLGDEACRFGYRNSLFKTEEPGRYIILSVVFRLSKRPQMRLEYGNVKERFEAAGGSTPMDLRKVIIDIRRQKLPDPAENPNAGSFFKNPLVDRSIFKCLRVDYPEVPHFRTEDNQIKIPAAWLIEKAGWKGKRIGDAGTWPSQPLVIVNYGNATGREILEFSEMISQDVDKKFGITLEREVNVV